MAQSFFAVQRDMPFGRVRVFAAKRPTVATPPLGSKAAKTTTAQTASPPAVSFATELQKSRPATLAALAPSVALSA